MEKLFLFENLEKEFPINSLNEFAEVTNTIFSSQNFAKEWLINSMQNNQNFEVIFEHFDKVGIDISVYKQFENTWRYDITGRNNEKFDGDMFIQERRVCASQALICAFNLREKQLKHFIPQSVEYSNGSVKLCYSAEEDIEIFNSEYFESQLNKEGYFVNETFYGGIDNKIRVIIENVKNNFNDNFQVPISDCIKVTLRIYVEDLHSLTLEPYFFKL